MSTDQSFDLSQFKATYFDECAELLATAEEIFMRLAEGIVTEDDLHAVFRCVHSIKGGGGAFALTDLVRFAHVFETALDMLRSGRAELTPHVADLLVRGNDALGDFIDSAQNGTPLSPDHGSDIIAELNTLVGGGAPKAPKENAAPAAPAPTPAPIPEIEQSSERCFKINFSPKPEMLASGNDPLLMLRELSSLGQMTVEPVLESLPLDLDSIDPKSCYLSFNITLITERDRSEIDEVFEFVEGDLATIEITESQEIEGDGWGLFDAPAPVAAAQDDDAGWGLFDPIEQPEIKAQADTAETSETSEAAPVALAPTAVAAAAQKSAPVSAPVHSASIRVDLDKIDKLVNMVGELVITQAMLGQQSSHFSVESHPELIQGLQELSNHTRELQENVMAIRAQPVKALFSKAPRLVRDLASKLNKQAKLVMIGENTEVDKTVIEQLSDPLTHLIRNSLDHGIEMPEDRIAAGKPAEGTVTLSAEHRSGRIIIEIRDDGKGIDRKRVLEKAIEKGLVERDHQLSDEQIDMLVFAPGFSTAAKVSDVSGRGVGMDVVRKNIQDVGGRVSVINMPGQGSRFILSLPLTLAVMDGMLVSVGNQRYVLPLTNIVESLRPTEQQTRHLVDVGNVLVLRGDYITLIPLHELFMVKGAITDPTKGLTVVVETEGGERIGLLVDELLGQQQVVIKSLDSNFRRVDGISAATILGDGRVALILDVSALRHLGANLSPGPVPSGAPTMEAAQ